METLVTAPCWTPVGHLTLVASTEGLRAALWDGDLARRVRIDARLVEDGDAHRVLSTTRSQLAEYFAGTRTRFDVPLDLRGTAFQLRAWRALTEIPFGETRTYGEQARLLGVPAAARAIGAANGRNPLSIVVPCHRLVGSRGALHGFAGGLAAKRTLLAHEAAPVRGAGG